MPVRGSILTLLVLGLSLGANAPAANSVDRSRTILRDYAECLVSDYDRPLAGDRDRPTARAITVFLTSSPTSKEAKRAGSMLNTEACLKGRNQTEIDRLRFAPSLLRGALFRAKYLKLGGNAGKDLALPAYDATAPWHLPHDDPFAVLQAIGECTVRENPVQARAAILAEVGSREENNAYAALVPSLTKCMPQNGTFTFSRAHLEGLMSEALFFLSGGTLPGAASRQSD